MTADKAIAPIGESKSDSEIVYDMRSAKRSKIWKRTSPKG
jgi:hypothetical protein